MGQYDQTPFFSIVIPALNEEKYLPRLLLDLANQTFQYFEVILVDAKSDDDTIVKARQFEKTFDTLTILNSDKRNVSHQRNLGAQKALADWLIFFDADNQLPNYFLQEIQNLIQLHCPDFLSTWFEPDSANLQDKAIATFSNLVIEFYKMTPHPVLREAFVCTKKQAFLNLGGFDEAIHSGEGSELLKRAYASKMSFRFHRKPKFVYSYRRLRKQGAFKIFINGIQIEFARLTNHKFSEEKARFLYPMEGGKFFELSSTQLKASNPDKHRNILRGGFNPSQLRITIPRNKPKRKTHSTWP